MAYVRQLMKVATRVPRQCPHLLRQDDARPAHFGWVVLQLGQTVLHWHHSLRIVDVNARAEFHARDGGGVDVDKPPKRMIGQQVTAAFRTVLSAASFGFHETAHKFGARGDLDVLWFPQSERIDRRGRPGPTGIAMAITHRLRSAIHLDFYSSAETLGCMCRHCFRVPSVNDGASRTRRRKDGVWSGYFSCSRRVAP